MGAGVSAGESNDDLVDNLMEGDFIKTSLVERVFRAVDRGEYFLPDPPVNAYRDVAWKNGNFHISAPCIYSEVMEGLKLEPGLSFLHLGSGTGYLSTMVGLVLGHNGVNHAVELHSDVVQYAYTKLEDFKLFSGAMDEYDFCEPKFVQGNCLCLASEGRLYDRVYCGAVCPNQYLHYLKSLVKIGGILIVPFNDQLMELKRVSDFEWNSRSLLPVSFASLIQPLESCDEIVHLPENEPLTLQEICRASIRNLLRKTIEIENPSVKFSRRETPKKKHNRRCRSSHGSIPISRTWRGTEELFDYLLLPTNRRRIQRDLANNTEEPETASSDSNSGDRSKSGTGTNNNNNKQEVRAIIEHEPSDDENDDSDNDEDDDENDEDNDDDEDDDDDDDINPIIFIDMSQFGDRHNEQQQNDGHNTETNSNNTSSDINNRVVVNRLHKNKDKDESDEKIVSSCSSSSSKSKADKKDNDHNKIVNHEHDEEKDDDHNEEDDGAQEEDDEEQEVEGAGCVEKKKDSKNDSNSKSRHLYSVNMLEAVTSSSDEDERKIRKKRLSKMRLEKRNVTKWRRLESNNESDNNNSNENNDMRAVVKFNELYGGCTRNIKFKLPPKMKMYKSPYTVHMKNKINELPLPVTLKKFLSFYREF